MQDSQSCYSPQGLPTKLLLAKVYRMGLSENTLRLSSTKYNQE